MTLSDADKNLFARTIGGALCYFMPMLACMVWPIGVGVVCLFVGWIMLPDVMIVEVDRDAE